MAMADRPEDQAGADSGDTLLAFDKDAESLPWLESDEDEEDRGIDSSRILAFAAGA